MFDSLGVNATKTLRQQIFVMFRTDGGKVDVEMPKVQKQAYESNNCALIAAAVHANSALVDLFSDADYVDSQNQRNWFAEVLRTGIFCPCPP